MSTPLSLPERIVAAAESAIVDASAAKYMTALQTESVEGFPHDFAKAALVAAFEVWAESLSDGGFLTEAYVKRAMAQAVRDVPAVKAV